uniref:Seroreactive antigen BMN1-8 n=1 Tax=Babesia microti TaxID=5868 RepID=Q9NIN3_BABMI|nr:seroreactive antigen BMN1-8 [Babesia microti]
MMKFNIDKIILINLIVLLNRNVVYCVDTNNSSLIESQPVTTNIDTDNTITTNKYTGTIINANIVEYREFEDEPLTIGFRYTIDKSQQNKLSHPNKIDKIKFSDYIIEFDDNAKLPTDNVICISIYTCKHNNPVLIRFSCSIEKYYYHYFYSMNNDTNKWNNHKLKYDKTYNEYTDNNGVNYYKIYYSDKQNSPTNGNEYEDVALARIHCNEERCANVKVDKIKYKNLEIYVKQLGTIINANIVEYLVFEDEPLTIGFRYTIDKSQQNELSHPNKIYKIKFSDYIIEFDDDAKLTTIGTVEDITIYTCKHNNPVLIRFSCSIEKYYYYYFYSMNNNTNKWNNHNLKYDNRFKEHSDKNGINYYEISAFKWSFSCFFVNKYEHKELARIHCNEERCANVKVDKIKYKNLEIYVKQLGTIINANIVEYLVFEDEPLTIGFRYTIDKSQQNELSHPNKIYKIKFSDYIIEFDDDAKLTTIGTVEDITIYTCKHNNPVLIRFSCSIEKYYYYYFYSMNNNTNKWNNHNLKYDNRFKEHSDKNGINYYEISAFKWSFSCFFVNKYEHKELARIHCNEEKCVNVKVDNIGNKNLEIYVK